MPNTITNEVREYLTNVSKDFPIDQVWQLFQMQYPEMSRNKDIDYLEELLKENQIKYFRKGEYSIFTLRELTSIYDLSKICKDMKEIYSAFSKQYPNKCSYERFYVETDNLDFIRKFKEVYKIDDKIRNNFNMFEINFIKDSIKNGVTKDETYNEYIKRFSNPLCRELFDDHYDIVKNHKENKFGKPSIDFTDNDIELLNKLANGNRTKAQLYQEFSNISKTEISMGTFNKKVDSLNLNIKDGRKGAKAIELTDNDIDLIKSLANGTISIASAMEEYNKSASVQVSYPTFLRRVKSLGLQDKFASNIHKSTPRKSNTGKKIIYTEEFIKDLTELYVVHSLSKCIDIMKTWGKYDNILQGDNVLSKLDKLLSRKGIKKDAKIDMTKRQINDETGITKIIKELAKDYTCGEVYDILVRDYNFKEIGNKSFASKWNRIMQFKVYDKVTDNDMSVIEDIVNGGYVGRAAAAEVHNRLPHKYTNAVIYRAISKVKSNPKSIHIHGITGPDKIIRLDSPSLIEEKPEEVVAWHSENIEENPMNKFQPIIDEVNSVFENRCKKLNVSTIAEDNTESLINALRVLLEYAEDTKQTIKTCTDQEDIIEQYRREIDHEIENLPFTDTDTTPQNKIKVLRMKRRGIKNTKENAELINPIANIIQHNASKFKQVLSTLEKKKEERDNFIFIPLVDTTMVSKYDWCKAGWAGSYRANAPILTTHKKEMQEEAKKKNSNIKKFRVQAEYMAWDGKPFHSVYYDVYATNVEKARENSKSFFDDLSKKHNNSRYTIKDAYLLNT